MPRIVLPITAFVIWFAVEAPVYAYLDPGSGSMLLQILLGGTAAVGVIGRLYWNRIAALFRGKDDSEDTH